MAYIWTNPKTGKLVLRDDSEGRKLYHTLDTTNHQEAKKILIQYESRILNGEWGLASDCSWERFRQDILKTYHKPPFFEKDSTYQKYKYAFEAFEKHIHPGNLSTVTPEMVKRFIVLRSNEVNLKTGRPVSPTTVSIDFRTLRAAFNQAVTVYHYIKTNPFNSVDEPEAKETLVKFLEPEQIEKLLQAAKESPTPFAYLMVLTYLYTGLRRQELIRLRWADVDLDNGWLYVRAWKDVKQEWNPKDGERAVPIPPDSPLLDALQTHKDASRGPLVFPNELGQVRCKTALNQLLRRIFKRAGLADFGGRIHVLRHTYGTAGAKTMDDLTALQRNMGHSDIKTTMIYAHINDKQQKAATTRFKLGIKAEEEAEVKKTEGKLQVV
jgi:integrase